MVVLKKTPRKFQTIISINPQEVNEVIQFCDSISEKDETFSYLIEFKIYGTFLIIFSPNKNIAHKRGLLFCKKYLKGGHFYSVK